MTLKKPNVSYCVINCPNYTISDQSGLDRIKISGGSKMKFEEKIPAT